MIRPGVAIAGILIAICPAIGAQLKVTVVDEANKPVLSDVLYYDGRQPTPFAITDNSGVAEISGLCQKIAGFEAHPRESGTYFDSQLVPCGNAVVIHLLTRSAPFGEAIKALQIPTTLADGSSGIVTFKAGVVSASKDVGARACQVSVHTVVNRQVYRVVADEWSEVTQPNATNITAEGLSDPLPNGTTSLPSTCDDAKPLIETTTASAKNQVMRDFGSGIHTANGVLQ